MELFKKKSTEFPDKFQENWEVHFDLCGKMYLSVLPSLPPVSW